MNQKIKEHILYKCTCKFNGKKSNSNQKWSKKNALVWEQKKSCVWKAIYWNPSTCACAMDKYLKSIKYASVVILTFFNILYIDILYSNKSLTKKK